MKSAGIWSHWFSSSRRPYKTGHWAARVYDIKLWRPPFMSSSDLILNEFIRPFDRVEGAAQHSSGSKSPWAAYFCFFKRENVYRPPFSCLSRSRTKWERMETADLIRNKRRNQNGWMRKYEYSDSATLGFSLLGKFDLQFAFVSLGSAKEKIRGRWATKDVISRFTSMKRKQNCFRSILIWLASHFNVFVKENVHNCGSWRNVMTVLNIGSMNGQL